MKHYLVIDDLGARAADLQAAAGKINEDGRRVTITTVHRVTDVVEPSKEQCRELARYDAFFVDFELSTRRVTAPPATFRLPIAGVSVPVTVTTGLGVMLFLRRVFQTEAYREERERVTVDRPRERREARVYAFVDITERRSQLYVGAAGRWFDAPYFKATTVPHLQTWLGDLDTWTTTAYYKLAHERSDRFDDVLPPLVDARHWGPFTEAYDVLRIYLGTRGRQGLLAAFKEQAKEELGVDVPWKHQTSQLAGRLNELQQLLHRYLDGFAPLDEWPDFKVRDHEQPLADLLSATAEFWTEPDVRYSLLAHRERHGMLADAQRRALAEEGR